MKKFCEKLFKKNNQNGYQSNPFKVLPNNSFSKKALELYEKQADIKKFSQMVINDGISDDFLAQTNAELQAKGIFDPFNEESFSRLAENTRLLGDLASND